MTVEVLLSAKGYRVSHKIGEGSGGRVFKATQQSTGQHVAVKVLSRIDLPESVWARRLARFQREIRLCGQLSHPDIVHLLDSGELEGDRHFAVFEFIPGVTLAEVLRDKGMLGVQQTRDLMMQLLPPLAYAHSQGIFHRDLKPSNVMVSGDGARDRVKVLDFGISIASSLDHSGSGERLTLSQEWVGTPAYAAPEQLAGEAGDAKSDLYAWGLMFLECLTGSAVVAGQSIPEIIRQQLLPEAHGLPEALRQHRLGLLLTRVLEKNPERRTGDAQTVLAALETISTSGLADVNGYLRASEEVPRVRTVTLSADTITDERHPAQVECRDATVVSCRVCFAGDGQGHRLESLDALIEDTNSLAKEVMNQFGANVSTSFGEYVVSYFGIYRATDSDARLALSAALELAARVEKGPSWLSEHGLSLHVQIGIHTGPVTVQWQGGNRRQIDGLTSGLAMKLAAIDDDELRATSAILVTEEFRSLVERQFDLELVRTLAPIVAPWAKAPVSVYRLAQGWRAASSRAREERGVFVGRERELAALAAAFERSRTGKGVPVLLIGEPGLGKSRLALELRASLRALGGEWLEVRCLPEWRQGFLRPISTLFRGLLGLSESEVADGGVNVERFIDQLGLQGPELVPLLCEWLALPTPQKYKPLTWSPQKRRAMLHDLLADALLVQMERGATLLVEDLHWADPSTLDCLNTLAQRARERSGLVLMTTRPGFQYPWVVPLEEFQLGGLDPSASTELVRALLPAIDEVDAARVAQRCDGVPLYIEELVLAQSTRLDTLAEAPSKSRLTLGAGSVPPTLRALLTGRLDEVRQAKPVAQFAATLGREFSLDQLALLSEQAEASVLGDLEQLVSAKLLMRHPQRAGTYSFRHALIREAAYESSVPLLRARMHARVAEGLEAGFPHIVEAQPDTLAHHYERAGEEERAVHYLLLSAKKSAMASAHVEAIVALEHAFALLEQLPASDQHARAEAEVMLARGATIVAKRGYTDPEAARSFERVAALVPAERDTLELAFAARWGLWYFYNTQANLERSWALANELDAIARAANSGTLALNVFHALCLTNFSLGRLDDASRASHETRALYDFDRHRDLCLVRGDDPHLACISWGAIADMFRGRHAEAVARTDEALALAKQLGYASLCAGVHANAAWMYLIWGSSGANEPNVELSRQHTHAAIALAEEHGFPFWTLYAGTIDTAARAANSSDPSVTEILQGSIEGWSAAGANLALSWLYSFAVQSLRNESEFDRALVASTNGLEHCERHNTRYFEPELYRQRAAVFFDGRNPQRSLEAGRLECAKALASAASCQSDWWELATRVTMARLPEATTEDHEELKALLSRFPVSEQEPPLVVEARALLQA